jgi:hypothetical protein
MRMKSEIPAKAIQRQTREYSVALADRPWLISGSRDEWNGRCIFRPKGKCYVTAMNMFMMLNMVNYYDSNVERALCRERVSFD